MQGKGYAAAFAVQRRAHGGCHLGGHRVSKWGVVMATGGWCLRSAVLRSLSSGNGMSKDEPFKQRRVRVLSVFVWVNKVLAARISADFERGFHRNTIDLNC